MAKPKVLLLGEIENAFDTWAELGQIAGIITPRSTNRADFIAECKSGALDGVQVCYRTFASISIAGHIDDELLSVLPRSLKYMCHNGAGYDSIDVAACTAHHVLVSNCPGAVDDSTADLALWLMLGALRNLNVALLNLREGSWRGTAPPALGHDPRGKVLGILGMGRIGQNLARKASAAFGMRIRYYNRRRLSAEIEGECGGAEWRDFEDLLRESDVLSLNLPLNSETTHTLSTPQFALMKPGIVIVNTARGAIIDEAALVAALGSGIVSSVGLDVYENEPAVHPGLLGNRRVLLVPHMGTYSVETQTKMEKWTMSNVRMAIEEGKLRSVVPEQQGLDFGDWFEVRKAKEQR